MLPAGWQRVEEESDREQLSRFKSDGWDSAIYKRNLEEGDKSGKKTGLVLGYLAGEF